MSMLQPWIYPLPLALLLILLGTVLLLRDHRISGSLLVVVAAGGLYLLSTPAVSGLLVSSLEQRFGVATADDLPAADAIVVLGGGILPVAEPRAHPDLGEAADRIWHGARLYRAGKAPLVITTGERPYVDLGPSAAEAARDLLVQLGVPASVVVARSDSSNTHEDAITVASETVRRDDVETLLLVTSALHMPRALGTFRALGLQVWPAPTDRQQVRTRVRGSWGWLPDPDAFHRSNKAWHEYVGLLYYRARGWL